MESPKNSITTLLIYADDLATFLRHGLIMHQVCVYKDWHTKKSKFISSFKKNKKA